jgi:zinc protease
MKQTKFQLKNKLNVLLIESKKSPVISVQMWVKTGSADEKKGEEGISHFIEHLVFKGTEKFKVGEIANTVEASGGELNAYTSFDQTVFYVTISNSFSDVALDVVSQMMGYPTFDAAETDSEREVVCEEIKMGQDSPRRRSSQMLFSSSYKKHSYGKPVIGYETNVRKWPVKKIQSYYRSRYVPSNMFLVISGDFFSSEMRKKVEHYFGGFKNYKLKKVKRTKEPIQKKFQFKAVSYKQQDHALHFAFKAPNVKNADVPALDVLAMILGQGDSSRLVKKLRLEKPLVSGISAFNYNPQDEGLFAISANYQGDKFEDVVKEVLEQIWLIQSVGVDWSEIKRAVVSISSEQFYSVETVDGLANKAGSQEFYFKDQNAQKKYLQRLGKVTPDDVVKVAKKYLKLEKLSASYMADEDLKDLNARLKTIPKWWKQIVQIQKPALKAKSKKMTIPKLEWKPGKSDSGLKIENLTLDSGLQILLAPTKEIPTVSAKMVFRGGARLETSDLMGVGEMTSRLWVSSTESRTEEQMMHEIEDSAISLSSFTGKNTSGFSVDYLSVFEDQALDLLVDNVLNTKFEETFILREKEMLHRAIKSREDNPAGICMRQFAKAIFGDHPLSYELTGTHESVNAITREDIVNFKERVLNSKNLTVCVVGDFNKNKWLKKIEQVDNTIKHKKYSVPIHKLNKLEKDQRLFTKSDKEQSHVIVGWRGLTLNSPDRLTLEVIEAVLAGQGGRLFYELRDKNSLAYSVAPIKMESIETGYFGGYIACSPEKVEKAIEMFQAEFDKLMQHKILPDELERAKKYLIGQHDIGLQKKSAICNLISFEHIYGNDYIKALHIANEYKKITADQVQELAKELFRKPKVISVVGS